MTVLRNFTTHNLVGHPASEMLYLASKAMQGLGLTRTAAALAVVSTVAHDGTLPDHEPGSGRG